MRFCCLQTLAIIFKESLDTGIFPSDWQKGNIVPILKKGDKQTLKNHRPVSLLPICGKILKRLMFDEMSKFFIENELISSNQSGFKRGDSCVYQLLSITHEIYKSFDEGHEVRGVFPIFSCLARWYNFQINSKRNIRELTKALA